MVMVRIDCQTPAQGLQCWIEPAGTTAGSLLASIRRDVPNATELLYCGTVLHPDTDLGLLSPKDNELHIHVSDGSPFDVSGIPANEAAEALRARDKFYKDAVPGNVLTHIMAPFCGSGLPDGVILRLWRKCVAQANGIEQAAINLYDQKVTLFVQGIESSNANV
jgi:hypothetical protein